LAPALAAPLSTWGFWKGATDAATADDDDNDWTFRTAGP
jgi:hypothetical protein